MRISTAYVDYVLAVKENQPIPHEEIREYFDYLDEKETKELPGDVWESDIENGPHWMLDVKFREDGCRAHKDNSPKNLNILRKIAFSRLKAVDGGKRISVKRKMFRAGLVSDFLFKVLFGE
jgi:hypothetical protein